MESKFGPDALLTSARRKRLFDLGFDGDSAVAYMIFMGMSDYEIAQLLSNGSDFDVINAVQLGRALWKTFPHKRTLN